VKEKSHLYAKLLLIMARYSDIMFLRESLRDWGFLLLFWLLHASFSFYIYFKLLAGILYNMAKIKLFSTDANVMEAEKQKLSKIPEHIAFILLEETISYPDLANLVIWCIELDIRHISLYDTQGRLKRNQKRLLQEIHLKQKQFVERGSFQVRWRPHVESVMSPGQRMVMVNGSGGVNGGVGYPDRNGNGTVIMGNQGNGKNGNGFGKHGSVVNISLLSREDGIPDLARAAGLVCQKVLKGDISPAEVTQELLEQDMATNKNMPDPSILVRLGITQSNVGFLPWQIRLTEMHSIKSHICVTSDDLIGVLRKYSRCEQRFGK